MLRPLLPLCSALLLAGCGVPDGAPSAPPTGSAVQVEAHVRFLADDLLEGREAGTRGYDIAARYVASQFTQTGLVPGGDDGGWLQAVPLLKAERLRQGELTLLGAGEPIRFDFQDDFLPGVNFDNPEWSLEAPLVFVGQAVVAPEYEQDDLAGVDLEGKIAVMLSGAPARFGNDQRAFYSSGREKLRLLGERGAVGVIYLGDPEREGKSPWARGAANWARPSMRLRDADGRPRDTFPQIRGSASLNVDGARQLFAAAGLDADAVFAQLKDGTLKPVELPLTARMSGAATLSSLESHNVVGLLPGSDAVGAAEHIVYTAHLDHVGIGAEVDGDAIYNGALDNALGVGILIETARLAALSPRAARSQVFVALTAEEKGLLGAEHFADSPGLDGRIVANINMDMPVMLSPQKDVIPIGIEHTSLKQVVEAAAAELDIALTPDPFPEEVVFVRSDQFAFVRRGIPAVYLDGGIHATVPEVDGREQLDGFLRNHYHQPSDDLNLSIHFPTAAQLATLNARIGQRVGNAADAPRWNEGNFFGGKFAGGR
ncbi:M28 family metallopeptidase [Pseudomarimonas salicorniae]|uniref:M28 family metallopeptidase n=1 Tax=Pseudomarimonas salicorniae TaxID=2933270 RepID=A0ABT0GEE5_9GAMM|nr:M28 family metallopeptidase [Lysobacter sp. CAU 1642]MCK7592392.1 M28 family metallopeptidase [Lysobacter sp. CAU 1642]